MKYALSTLAIATMTAGAAAAGGYTPVVVEPAPITPVVTAPVGNWQGGYAGATLGYAFGGDDVVGVSDGDTLLEGDLGEFELSGVNAGLRAGYLWQRDRLVIGPELSIEGGNIDDDIDLVDDGDVTIGSGTSEVNHVIALKLKTGYEVAPNTLLYGVAGVARGDFTYELDGGPAFSGKDDYTANGFVFGVGVERKVSDRMSVTGEIEHTEFESETVDIGDFTTEASPSFSNVKLGVNFRF